MVEADARGQPQHRRRDRRTRRHQFLTAGGVLARAPDVPAVARRRPQDVTDAVGDSRRARPGPPGPGTGAPVATSTAVPSTRAATAWVRPARIRPDHPPRARTAHRVTVHRGVVEPGERDRRDQLAPRGSGRRRRPAVPTPRAGEREPVGSARAAATPSRVGTNGDCRCGAVRWSPVASLPGRRAAVRRRQPVAVSGRSRRRWSSARAGPTAARGGQPGRPLHPGRVGRSRAGRRGCGRRCRAG